MISRNARFQISRLKRELAVAKKRIEELNEASDFWLQQFINSQDKHRRSNQMANVYKDGMHSFEAIIESKDKQMLIKIKMFFQMSQILILIIMRKIKIS